MSEGSKEKGTSKNKRGLLIGSIILTAIGLIGLIIRSSSDVRLFSLIDGIGGIILGPDASGGVGRLQVLTGTLAGSCYFFLGVGLFVPYMMGILFVSGKPVERWMDDAALSTNGFMLAGFTLCAMGYVGALLRYFSTAMPLSGEAVMRDIENHPLNPFSYLDGGVSFMAYAWLQLLIAGAVFLAVFMIGTCIDGHVAAKRRRGEVSKNMDTALKVLSVALPLAFAVFGTRPLMRALGLRGGEYSKWQMAALYGLNFLMPMICLRQWNHAVLLPNGPALKLVVGIVALPVCFIPGVALAVYLHKIVGMLIFVALCAVGVAIFCKIFSLVDMDAIVEMQAQQRAREEKEKQEKEQQRQREREAYIDNLEYKVAHNIGLDHRETGDLLRAHSHGETSSAESTKDWYWEHRGEE